MFIESDTFQTEIPLKSASFGQFAQDFHKWLELTPETLPRLERGLKEVVLPASIKQQLPPPAAFLLKTIMNCC